MIAQATPLPEAVTRRGRVVRLHQPELKKLAECRDCGLHTPRARQLAGMCPGCIRRWLSQAPDAEGSR